MTYTGTLSEGDLEFITRVRGEWMTAALSTEPADKPAAEQAITALYAAHGLEAVPVIWMDSPLGCIFAAGVLSQLRDQLGGQLGDQLRGQLGGQLGGQLRDQLGGQLWDQLGGQLWDQLGDQLRDQLWDQLRDQLRGQLWDQLGGQLRDQLRDQLGGQLWGQLGSQLGDQLRGQLGGQLGGQLWGQLGGQLGDQLRGQLWDQLSRSLYPWNDAYWLAFYACALPVAGLPAKPELDALARAVATTGWLIPLCGVVIAGTRPAVISQEGPQGRLHCPDGPALAWADGYALHAWHGTRVPASLIEEDWDADRALAERNAEIRRCAIEKLGWDRLESRLAKVADAPDPGNPGCMITLYDLPGALADLYDAPARLLLVTNGSVERDGSRRRYGLPVPAHHSDPVEAAASLYGWDAEEYRCLEVRR